LPRYPSTRNPGILLEKFPELKVLGDIISFWSSSPSRRISSQPLLALAL